MDRNKRKRFFSSNLMAKKKKDLFLKVGIKGFICTCNGNEKQCIRESYNLLNEYADNLYGEEKLIEESNECNAPIDDEVDESQKEVESLKLKSTETDRRFKASDTGVIHCLSIRTNALDPDTVIRDDEMDEFQKEIESLKSKSTERRFQAVDTGVNNCIFIKTNLPDPVNLARTIMKDLAEKTQLKARFLLRIFPIEVTCKAYVDDIVIAAGPLFDAYLTTEPVTYGIVFTKRCNSSVKRDDVIQKLAAMVQERNRNHKVDLSNPDFTIVVEAIKNICGLAVIPEYNRFCKYNLRQLCGEAQNDEKPSNKQTPDPSNGDSEEIISQPNGGD